MGKTILKSVGWEENKKIYNAIFKAFFIMAGLVFMLGFFIFLLINQINIYNILMLLSIVLLPIMFTFIITKITLFLIKIFIIKENKK